MSLRTRLEDISVSLEEKDEKPESITVSETDDTGMELSSVWMEEYERTSLLESVDGDGETETDIRPLTYYNQITDDELVSDLSDVFDDIKSVITVSDEWTVRPFSFSTLSVSEEGDFDNPFAPEWADYGAMAFVTNESSEISTRGKEILQLIVDEMAEFEVVDVSDLNTVEVNFSDFQPCHLQSIHVYVETPNPHRYYSDVETVEEYVSVVADSEEEVDELLSEESYEVFIRIDDPHSDGSELPDELIETAESVMIDRITSAVDSEVDWFYESQSIVFNEEGSGEQTSFYLRVPFCSEL